MPLDQRLRRVHVDLERPEAPVVDAHDPRAGVQRAVQLVGAVHFDEHVEPERRARA